MNELDAEHDDAGLAPWWTGAETFHISARQIVPGENGKLQAYQDKMEAWVGYIMGLGADGVFIDVIHKRCHCYATLT
jgi:hypothetical protein